MNQIESLYIHVPFCATKCHYCAFNTYAFHKEQARRYLGALRSEMELYRLDSDGLKTVFIGGGTPSILSAESLEGLFKHLHAVFDVNGTAEITVECNPGTVDRQKLEVMRSAGVNRLSFGVQAMDDATLEQLGRIHTVDEVLQSYDLARRVGFDNINLDLMFGLPNQTVEGWKACLKEVIALRPEHISAYSLMLEEGTVFYESWRSGELQRLPDEIEAEMYQVTIDTLIRHGYEHYEISSFAKPSFTARHNLVYWKNRSYVGLGPGACGYVNGARYSNIRGVQEYVESLKLGRKPIADSEQLTGRDEKAETVILGLRMREGIREEDYRRRFGEPIEAEFEDVLDKWIGVSLLEWRGENLRLTNQGLFLANEVFVDFL
ncbi:MAG: radical SAM family heme chaperone HemW [Candidatus Poribacteria bacterium]|nr:radical SAM family heme chaperone HemW [Candidatus Poribacteria bacterium]MDE0504838.1 radical SAM family heme chaperone HemW [Candidatus Poribacteria bacterium]